MRILTPDNYPFFYQTLALNRPPQPNVPRSEYLPTALLFAPGESVGREANVAETREYLCGGEWDARSRELEEDAIT
ncbi:MAG: hypothetical protein J7647_01635 [Cyanobacteria bacterium SBLK]|nr:hypothetical protein [Cyanobacteria bacterium SBLK]